MTKIAGIGMTEFAKKNFAGAGMGKPMIDLDPESFIDFINADLSSLSPKSAIVGSKSMPFCKYLFIGNFTTARLSHVKLDNCNAQYIRSGYTARRDFELPVLERWLELPFAPPLADVLMVILYSREQLLKEARDGEQVTDKEWGVVGVLGLDRAEVPPMPPITMMRNALGIAEGGNGVPLDKAEYLEACNYWDAYAMVK